MRVLVTGSRTWTDVDEVHDALDALHLLWGEQGRSSAFVLVHGCALGADQIADVWANQEYVANSGVVVEKHPYWSHLGRAGGPERNKHMVSLGADYVLAFIKDNSAGATGCARMAREAGLMVLEYRQ